MCEKTCVFILYLPNVTIVCEIPELFDSTCIKHYITFQVPENGNVINVK